jgi:hypothetical protein
MNARALLRRMLLGRVRANRLVCLAQDPATAEFWRSALAGIDGVAIEAHPPAQGLSEAIRRGFAPLGPLADEGLLQAVGPRRSRLELLRFGLSRLHARPAIIRHRPLTDYLERMPGSAVLVIDAQDWLDMEDALQPVVLAKGLTVVVDLRGPAAVDGFPQAPEGLRAVEAGDLRILTCPDSGDSPSGEDVPGNVGGGAIRQRLVFGRGFSIDEKGAPYVLADGPPISFQLCLPSPANEVVLLLEGAREPPLRLFVDGKVTAFTADPGAEGTRIGFCAVRLACRAVIEVTLAFGVGALRRSVGPVKLREAVATALEPGGQA